MNCLFPFRQHIYILLCGIIVTMAGLTIVDTSQNLLRSPDGMRNEFFLYFEFVSFHSEYFPKFYWGRRSRPPTQLNENIFICVTLHMSFSDQDIGHNKFFSGMSSARQELRRTICGQSKSWNIFCWSISCISWSTRKELLLTSGWAAGLVCILCHLGNGSALRISRFQAFFLTNDLKKFCNHSWTKSYIYVLGVSAVCPFYAEDSRFSKVLTISLFSHSAKVFIYLFITQINFLLLDNKSLFSLYTP